MSSVEYKHKHQFGFYLFANLLAAYVPSVLGVISYGGDIWTWVLSPVLIFLLFLKSGVWGALVTYTTFAAILLSCTAQFYNSPNKWWLPGVLFLVFTLQAAVVWYVSNWI
jgi:hypothetical protein